MTDMRAQMELLQRLVSERPTAAAPTRGSNEGEHLRLTRLTENDDIEAYLTTFERMMGAYEIDRARWSYKLAPQLTGKAQQAYAALSPEDGQDYATVKAAILRRYNINEETYRQRFRSLKLKPNETPLELCTRLSDLVSRWTKDCATVAEIRDLMVKEQLLTTLPEDVRMWVREKKPKSSAEAGGLAEDYLQARSMESLGRNTKSESLSKNIKKENSTQEKPPPGKCPRCGDYGHWARNCSKPRPKRDGSWQPRNERSSYIDGVKCFTCSEKGHFASNCPNRSLYCNEVNRPTRSGKQERVYRHGTINGVYCKDIVVDTGASRTLVRKELVSQDDILDGEVTIQCAHGDVVSYPLAIVKITIGGKDVITQAAVSDSLPASALLGWDIPQLMTLVKGETTETDYEEDGNPEQALAAVTRQQRRKGEQGTSKDEGASASPTPVETPEDVPHDDVAEEEGSDSPFNFSDSFFSLYRPPESGPDQSSKAGEQEALSYYSGGRRAATERTGYLR